MIHTRALTANEVYDTAVCQRLGDNPPCKPPPHPPAKHVAGPHRPRRPCGSKHWATLGGSGSGLPDRGHAVRPGASATDTSPPTEETRNVPEPANPGRLCRPIHRLRATVRQTLSVTLRDASEGFWLWLQATAIQRVGAFLLGEGLAFRV